MGDSIFSGLESFGLGGLEGMNLFEEKKKEEEKKEVPVVTEEDFLLDKSMQCPVCDADFKIRAVKGSKAKLIGTDKDLRPRYEQLDVVKYDAIVCPYCGYAALTRYFPTILDSQKKKVREKISMSFKANFNYPSVYSYDDAMDKYKLTLANAVVKGAKASEKAYICLKSAWILRGKGEEIGEAHPDYAKIKAMEGEYIKNAYEGFCVAVQSENFPMCGMDEMTVEYLIAVLASQTGHIDVASRSVAKILAANSASPRMKDKARELKEEIVKLIRNK